LKPQKTDVFITSAYAVALLQVLPLAAVAEFDGKGHIAMLLHNFISLLDDGNRLLKASKAKKSNMSRAQQSDLAQICRRSMTEPRDDESDSEALTPRLLGLRGLDVCISRLRQAGYMHQLIDSKTFSKISQILSPGGDVLTARGINAEAHLAISTLESLTIGEFVGNDKDEQKALEFAAANIAASLPAYIVPGHGQYIDDTSLLLRLCLNLSTREASSCQVFAHHKITSTVVVMIQEGFDIIGNAPEANRSDLIIDILVLALAFLTNLTEEFPGCRSNFLQATPSRLSDLLILLGLFRTRHEKAASAVTESETKANVAFGYLAVLLCSLCLNNKIRSLVVTEFHDGQLMKLREAMAQFVVFHRTIDMASETETGEIAKPQALFVDKLQQVLSTLKSACATSTC